MTLLNDARTCSRFSSSFVRGKIRIKKAEDGRLYGVKTMKLVDENAAQDVFRKKEEQREKRRENRIRKVHR